MRCYVSREVSQCPWALPSLSSRLGYGTGRHAMPNAFQSLGDDASLSSPGSLENGGFVLKSMGF